ncbi:MAG: UDP-glucose--hexose-1-phosphate uridylyltransferase [Clostridia bacterium]|nr:UDP-glucose--hexose-1-phosphate uridylyltransferase [Clostridia bacterium]
MDTEIYLLVSYAIQTGLIEPCDRMWAINRVLEVMQLDSIGEVMTLQMLELPEILERLTQNAVERGICEDNQVARDLFDTKLMGALTPAPHEVRAKFNALYQQSPAAATDWFCKFSQDTNYIRRDRIAKDKKWKYDCEYGTLDITINLSKPEKDPKAIAAAKLAPQSGYPKCMLCAENEGYAGRMNHPARQNHRIIPVTINGSDWYFQYSPYVYYNEHCIVFSGEHTPMRITRATFEKFMDFLEQFPHYFVGSNAGLPIVGGSILSHDHFQGGHYTFAMEKTAIETKLSFKGFEDVEAGIINWPMSVIRLRCENRSRLIELADKIHQIWCGYTDEAAFIFAETDGEPHNAITPIARRHGKAFELDLALRNNITTAEHPLGVYHPHAEKHHIKKENIGLIEVMGLAVLPARLNKELADLKTAILNGSDIRADETIRTEKIFKKEVGPVFAAVLEDAGVYKRTAEGKAAFLRFVDAVNQED